MKNITKPKEELVTELEILRSRVAALEQAEAEHELTEEALRESEARFRVMFENSHDLLAVTDKNGRAIWANLAWREILGYTQETQGHPTEKVHPEDRTRVNEAWQAMERGEGDITNLEYRYKTANGDYIFLETTVRKLTVKGNPLLYMIAHNITERKQAEEEIRNQRDRAKMLAEASQVFTNASLDFQTLLDTIARLTAELIGEACIITLLSEDGQWLNPTAFHHPNSEARALMYELLTSVTPSPIGEGLVERVTQTNQPLLIPTLDPEQAHTLIASKYRPYLERFGIHSLLVVPLYVQNRVIGTLGVSRSHFGPAYTIDDQIFLQNLADQAALAIENARLLEAERAARKQLHDLASYLQTAREEERTRIAREIHDEFGQVLTALKMDLSWLSKRLPHQGKTDLWEKSISMSELVDDAIQTVRRIATELRPGLLDDLGLVAALEWQAQEFTDRTEINCELNVAEEDFTLDRDLGTDIFRIFQETLTNVARHTQATEVRVELKGTPDELVLVVRDDGQGITEDQVFASKSLGLIGMRERVRPRGGQITFEGVPGQGTTVTVRIPQTDQEERRP